MTAVSGAVRARRDIPHPLQEAPAERGERIAEREPEMTRLFLSHGKTDIAVRRLKGFPESDADSEAAKEAPATLQTL